MLTVSRGRTADARVGIITIIDQELAAMQAAVGTGHNLPQSPYYLRAPGDFDVVVRQAPDRSNVPAIKPVDRMLEDFGPELVLIVGVAGGVASRGVTRGDVVVADYLHYGDFRKLSGSGDHRRYYAYDQPSVSIRETYVDPARNDGGWRDRIRATPPMPVTPTVHIGSLVAGEKLLGDPTHEEQKRILRDFSDALAIDMESVGAARATHEGRRYVNYNPRFLVVRGISDLVRDAQPPADAHQPGSSTSPGASSAGTTQRPAEPAAPFENSAERELWRDFAAAVAAAFASELVERVISGHEPIVGGP